MRNQTKLWIPYTKNSIKKLDALLKHKSHKEKTKERTKHTFHTRLVNLKHVKLSNDQINTLYLRFDYTIKNNAKQFVNTLIIGTENVIRYLYLRIQNSSVYVKMKKIKKIVDTETCNTLYMKDSNII